jgi:VIT1/CCC1 family predicted Fe2+/Mn2+ transporter
MDERFRSRKWFLTLLVFGTVTGLLIGEYVSELIWRDTVIALGASYFTANVFAKKVGGGAE